jgi:hypothetical protein
LLVQMVVVVERSFHQLILSGGFQVKNSPTLHACFTGVVYLSVYVTVECFHKLVSLRLLELQVYGQTKIGALYSIRWNVVVTVIDPRLEIG